MAVATVVVYIALGVVAALAHIEAEQANKSLCALREDVSEKVNQGNRFLITHPHGFAGVPGATLRLSLASQQKTLQSLNGLDC